MESSSRLNIVKQWVIWIITLRWFAGIGLIFVLVINQFFWKFPVAQYWLWGLCTLLFVYNTCFYCFAHGTCGIAFLINSPNKFIPFAFSQTFIDLILLTLSLHFGGGVENPFIFFYIFHVAIGCILYSRQKAYITVILASVLLNLLLWSEYYEIVSHYHLSWLVPPSLYKNSGYLLAVGGIMSLTFLFAAYMTSFLAGQLREREAELEHTQELLRERSTSCEISYAELEKIHKEKSEFMRMVAHELRAPLAAVQSCLQVALEYFGAQLTGKPKELIERAEKRSGSLIALVRDLLNLSRADEVIKHANFETLNIEEILTSVIELAKPHAQSKEIEIISQLKGENLLIKGDRGGLEEVFTNLLNNAVKYSHSNTKVRIQVNQTAHEIEIAFYDQGIGISPEDLSLLFSQFFRANNAKAMQVEGTGLGLALTKKIVEIHGGNIEVESQLDKGSCFRVKLPVFQEDMPSPENFQK